MEVRQREKVMEEGLKDDGRVRGGYRVKKEERDVKEPMQRSEES